MTAYSATKFAIRDMTQCAANDPVLVGELSIAKLTQEAVQWIIWMSTTHPLPTSRKARGPHQ